jgi:hypothetical protein
LLPEFINELPFFLGGELLHRGHLIENHAPKLPRTGKVAKSKITPPPRPMRAWTVYLKNGNG